MTLPPPPASTLPLSAVLMHPTAKVTQDLPSSKRTGGLETHTLLTKCPSCLILAQFSHTHPDHRGRRYCCHQSPSITDVFWLMVLSWPPTPPLINSYPANWSDEKVKKESKKEVQVFPWGSKLRTEIAENIWTKSNCKPNLGASSNNFPQSNGTKFETLSHQLVLPRS